jgi:hypothetical protein
MGCCLNDEAARKWNRPPWSAPSASQVAGVAATTRKVRLAGLAGCAPVLPPPVASLPASPCARSSVSQRGSSLPYPELAFRRAATSGVARR